MIHRRQLLQGALTGAGSLLVGRQALAQRGLQSQTIAEDLLLLRGQGENILASPSDNGLLLVDGGNSDDGAALLHSLSQAFGNSDIEALINTHWHPGQTGQNETLGSQGTEIIAHENTRLWLGTETIVRWQDRVYPPVPEAARPATTFYDNYQRTCLGESVECGYVLQAHTDGDIYVHFRERKVLMAGGILSSESWPVIDWSTAGWIGGMLKGLRQLAEIADDSTLIVPATGAPIDRSELVAQADMYEDIMGKLKIMLESGYGIAEVLAENPTASYKPEWGSPELFLTLAFRSFWGHVRQFDVV